jgi:exodeoxyribonuclease VIII
MPHFMVDLETLGVRPGSVILSIGAVEFSRDGLGASFSSIIDTQSCLDAGLAVDPKTVSWWEGQSEEARQVLDRANNGGVNLSWALGEFSKFLTRAAVPTAVYVWGNGADFDNALLAEAYRRCGMGQAPWQPAGARCYRTLKNLARHVKIDRQGTFHNALDDAKSQASHAIRLMEELKIEW